MTDVTLLDELRAVMDSLNERHEKDLDRISILRATFDPDEYYTDYFLQWRVKK